MAIRGEAVVEAWKEQVRSGQIDQVVRELLVLHYDPTYASSMVRNFTQNGQATACVAANRSPEALRDVARTLCQHVGV